jgi:hypothetical protein
MSSPRADFDELMRRVDRGREFADASYEPIFYLVFHPRDILEVKRLMPGWTARLRNDGSQRTARTRSIGPKPIRPWRMR